MSKDYIEQLAQLVTAAFGLAAGLAWNSAIQELIGLLIPEATFSSIVGKLVYAIILTAAAVWITKKISDLKDKAKP